ncbi:MAG: NAD(P)-binding domain-containing protein [Candidatus Dormiibacterota bacterium]
MVVVGSGPGALQLSYSLTRLGATHAVVSADEGPGGMFRKWPFFQRMLSWTKPFAPFARRSREYERYDWNSLLADEEELRGLQADHMDGTSYFPSRQEMEAGLTAFADRAGVKVRYGCRWESTRPEGNGFVLGTSDGEYRAPVLVFAVGVAEPWRPSSTTGLDLARHYADMDDAEAYRGKDVFIVGKKNSAFEVANGLLPWARSITLASPSPAKTSVETRSLVGVRARYVQPIEDNALGGGVWVVNASIDAVERTGSGFRVKTHYSDGSGSHVFDADEVIAATGFQAPLLDLPKLGVTTFGQSGVPAQGAFWECPTVPGIYFAGTLSQGAAGLNKHGVPSNSGAVHGHRYNARVLAQHIAGAHFGVAAPREPLEAGAVVGRLLDELSGQPGYGAEIFHQRSYLARVISIDAGEGVYDEGIQPLTHFLDAGGPDAVAATLETNSGGDIYPAIYVRRRGAAIDEKILDQDVLLDFRGEKQQERLTELLAPLLGATVK